MTKSTLAHNRIETLQRWMQQHNCEAFLIEDRINVYYFSGIDASLASLFVTQDKALLIVDGRYIEMAKQLCPFSCALASDFSLNHCLKEVKSLGFDSELMTYQRYLSLQQSASSIQLLGFAHCLRALRMIKDQEEIGLLKQAAALGVQGFDLVISLIKEEISEKEMALELEIFWKKQGAKGLAFEPIIAFGVNSSKPHHRASSLKLVKNQPILIDIGVNFHFYHSDMTRVMFFGEPSDKMRAIYEIVRSAQELALNHCHPGTSLKDLDQVARAYIESQGYGPYFTHSLGHGIGLEIHEMPFIRQTAEEICLQPGMVITIEPGIYLPQVGGVRIEDTIVITPSGHENLTPRSKDLCVLNP